MVGKVLFTCDFCSKDFKTEKGYHNHHCAKMQREDDFKSIKGQAAFSYYKKWIHAKHKSNQVINPDTFKTSAYFNAFVKFYELIKQTKIPKIDTYINLMVRKKIDPKIWHLSETYKIYLEYITYQLPLSEHVEITVNTIFNCTEAAGVDVSEVFDILAPNEVIELISRRQLSPWVLLKSKKFAEFVQQKANQEEQKILGSIINPSYWAKKYKNNTKDAKSVIEYVAELGI